MGHLASRLITSTSWCPNYSWVSASGHLASRRITSTSWFPNYSWVSASSHFGPGFQGEPSIVTNFTKRRKVQVIESEMLDSASLLQFASLAQPCSQAHVLEREVGARPWQWRQREHHGGGLIASSQELWRSPGMPGIQPRNRGAAKRADSARRARRRSRRLLNRQAGSFLGEPEGGSGQ